MNNNPYDKLFSQNPPIQQFPIDNSKNPYHGVFSKNLSKENPYEYVGGIGGLGESKYDTNVSIEDLYNLDKIRASRQPWYEQAGAMLNQAVVGEIIGGTLMVGGAVFEIPEMVLNTLNESENDFHNALFDIGKGLSDWAQETTPIYQTGERFSDPGWWFQNGVSVASSLSMMLPGMAVAKGVRMLSGAMRLGITATGLLETGLGALAMRYSEGFREASGVYDSIYQQGLQAYREGKLPDIKSEDEIKSIASNAAALDYNLNYLNLAFDFIQLGSILKPFKGLTRNAGLLDYDLAKSVGKLPKSKLGKAFHWLAEPGKGLLEQTSEGVEEVINTIAQFEGERKGRLDLGLEKEDNSSVGERIMDYLGRPETMDSFIWGTLGGVAFKQGAKVLGFDETKTQLNRKLSEIAGREETIKQFSQHFNAINNGEVVTDDNGEVLNDYSKTTVEQRLELTNDLKNKMAFRLGLDAAQAGNIDILLTQLDDSNFKNSLIQSGVATQETIATDIQNIKKEVLRAEDTYSKYFQRLYELPINDNVKRKLLNEAIQLDYRRTSALEGIRELETEYNNLYSKDGFIQVNSSNPNLNPTLQMESLSAAIALVTNDIEDAKKSNNEYAVKQGEKIKSNLQKKLNSIPKHEHINPKLIDVRIPFNLAQQEILKEYVNIFSEGIANVDSKDNVSKATEEITNRHNKINSELNKNIKDEELKRKNERIASEKTAKWNTLIDKAVNEKELDSIIDQMDKAEVTTPELIDRVAMKRQSLGGQQVETNAPQSQQSFDSFLDGIQTAPLEETIPSNDMENFDAFLDAQSQESTNKESTEGTSSSIKAKKADIERRRQEELDKYFGKDSGELIVNPEFVAIREQIMKDKYLSQEEKVAAQKLAKKLADVGKSQQEIIDRLNEKFPLDIKYTETEVNRINAKYDAEYVDAVKKGEMTKEQAMQALEEAGRKDSSAYAKIAALEQEQVTEDSGLEPDNTDLGTLLEETSIDVDTEIKSDEITTVVSDNTYFDDSKSKVVDEAYSSLVEDMKNANGAKTVDSDGNITYENSKIENAYNALAHQDRKYTRIKDGKTVKYTDTSNELSDTAPLELLTPGKYAVGTKVEFIVTDKDDLEIYDPESKDKEIITWAVYKNKLRERITENPIIKDIERRRRGELFYKSNSLQKQADLAKTLDFSDRSDKELWKVLGMFFEAVNEFTSKGEKYIIKQGNSKFYKDIVNSKGEIVITIERQGLEYDIFNTNRELAKDIISFAESKGYNKEEENQINAKYAAELKEVTQSSNAQDITQLQDYKNNIPIQLSIDGKELNAYLHSVSWINQENVKGDLVQDAINLRNIREGILSKGSYSTTIESISDGAIFELNNNAKHSIKEAVGEDTNYIIGVETGVGIKTGKNKMLSESISNESTVPGLTYLVVKSHNGYFGIPVSNSKIGNNPNKEAIKSTIVSAIDAYLTDNTETRDSIRNITGLNILQLSDLEYLLNMYLGFYNTNGNFLRDIIMTIPHGTKNTYFTIQNKTIEFFDGDLKTGGRVYSVSKENQKQKDLFLDKLAGSLDNFYLNNSIEAFDNNENIPIFDDTNNIVPKPYRDLIMESFTTNVKGNKVSEVNGKSIYSYTLQPVYRFDFNEFLPKETVVEEKVIEKVTEEKTNEGLSSDTDNLINGFLNFSDFPGTFNSNFNKDIKNSHKNC